MGRLPKMDKLARRKKAGKSPLAGVVPPRGSFVLEANWDRAEELRVDRLGPEEKDIEDPERPSTSLH